MIQKVFEAFLSQLCFYFRSRYLIYVIFCFIDQFLNIFEDFTDDLIQHNLYLFHPKVSNKLTKLIDMQLPFLIFKFFLIFNSKLFQILLFHP